MTVDNINSSPLEDLPGYDAFKAKLKTRMYEKRDRDMNVDPDISVSFHYLCLYFLCFNTYLSLDLNTNSAGKP